jgi:hypothetical protein
MNTKIADNLKKKKKNRKKEKRKKKHNNSIIFFFMKQVWTNIEGNRANLVQTAWALLSLIEAGQVSASFSPQLFALHYNIALLHSTKECNAFEKEQISLKKSSYIYIYIYE